MAAYMRSDVCCLKHRHKIRTVTIGAKIQASKGKDWIRVGGADTLSMSFMCTKRITSVAISLQPASLDI